MGDPAPLTDQAVGEFLQRYRKRVDAWIFDKGDLPLLPPDDAYQALAQARLYDRITELRSIEKDYNAHIVKLAREAGVIQDDQSTPAQTETGKVTPGSPIRCQTASAPTGANPPPTTSHDAQTGVKSTNTNPVTPSQASSPKKKEPEGSSGTSLPKKNLKAPLGTSSKEKKKLGASSGTSSKQKKNLDEQAATSTLRNIAEPKCSDSLAEKAGRLSLTDERAMSPPSNVARDTTPSAREPTPSLRPSLIKKGAESRPAPTEQEYPSLPPAKRPTFSEAVARPPLLSIPGQTSMPARSTPPVLLGSQHGPLGIPSVPATALSPVQPPCNHVDELSCECPHPWTRWGTRHECPTTRTMPPREYSTHPDKDLAFCFYLFQRGGCKNGYKCAARHWAPEAQEKLWMLPTFLRECEKHKKNFKSLPPDMDPFYESSGGQPRLNRQCQWVLGQNKVVSELPKEWEHLIRDIDAERRNIEAQKRAKREKRTEAQGRKAVQEDRKKNIKTINAGKPLETTVDLSSFIKPPRAKQPKANKPKFQGNFSDLPLDEDGCILDRSGNALEERF